MSDLSAANKVLFRYYPSLAGGRVQPWNQGEGLSGAELWRVEALGHAFALRRWPSEHPSPHRLEAIHGVLLHAWQNGFRLHPVPLVTNGGGTFVAEDRCLWEVAPWLPGTADFRRQPTPEKLCAAMKALAQFHVAVSDLARPNSDETVPAVANRWGLLQELANGDLERLVEAVGASKENPFYDRANRFLTLFRGGINLLWRTLDRARWFRGPQQPCIRDIWHSHVLYTGERVTGLIDFGAMKNDHVATDVARLLGSLAGDDASARQIGLAAYTQIRPLTEDEKNLVDRLDETGTVLAGINWIRWLFQERREFLHRGLVQDRFDEILARTHHWSRRATLRQ